MKKYYLYRKDFRIYTDWITIIPTIELHLNEMAYREKNFALAFSWMIFHARLFWIEKQQGENS